MELTILRRVGPWPKAGSSELLGQSLRRQFCSLFDAEDCDGRTPKRSKKGKGMKGEAFHMDRDL